MNTIKAIFIVLAIFNISLAHAGSFAKANAENFIKTYQQDIGITNDEMQSFDSINNYNPQNILSSKQKEELKKLETLNIGNTSLSRIVRSTERYREKVNLFNESFNAMNKVLDTVKSVDEGKIQEFINNSSIGENIDKVSSTRKDMALSWSNLGNSFKESSEVLYNASGSAWNISRATFLNVKAIKGLKSLKNIHQIRQAKKVVDNVTFVSLMAHIGGAVYKNDIGNDIGATDELISSLSILEDELKTLRSKGGKYLAIASNAAQMIANIRELNKLNAIDDSVFNDESRSHIQTLKTTIQNKVSMGVSSVTASLLQDSNLVLAGASTVAKELHNSFRETDNVRKNYKVQFDLKVAEEANDRMDAVLADLADTQDYFQNELGEKVLDNINLATELGFIEPSKKKEQPIAENENKNGVVDDANELAESERNIQRTKLNEGISEAKRLKSVNNKLSIEYQELYVQAAQNPDDSALQQRLADKKAEFIRNAVAFQELEAAIIKNAEGYTDFNGNPYYKGKKIVDENGEAILIDGTIAANRKAKEKLQTLRAEAAEQARQQAESARQKEIAKQNQVVKVKQNIKNWQAEKSSKQSRIDQLLAALNQAHKANKQLNSVQVSELQQLRKEIAQLDKYIRIASSNIGISIPDPVAPVSNSNNLAAINRQINSKQAELNNLQQELAALGGSSSSVDRFKVRSLLIKYRLINQIYDKYNGDITKVSATDKIKLKALAKTLPNNWVRLFQNAPTRYANAQAQATLIESSNAESQRIVNRINQLQNQIASLSNQAGQSLEQQQELVSQYESSRQDLIALVNDSNDATKENLGSDSGVEGGSENGGGGTGGGNDDDRGPGDGDPVDNFPNLGYVSGKLKDVSALFTTDAATSNNGEGGIVRDANNKINANNVSPEITVRIDSSTRGSYQYTDWGAWNSTGHVYTANQEIEKGHWIIGRSTNVNDIPKTGSATYNGEIMGTAYSGENITGNVALTAQFAEQRVDGTFNFKRADGSDWIRAETGRMSYTDAANNHTHRINFQTQASTIYQNGNAINAGSNIRGSFFGKTAEEIGGEWAIWNVPDSVGGADGVFRAKQ